MRQNVAINILISCVLFLLTMSSAVALDEEAVRYVDLALEVGQYDPDYVDAYLGSSARAEAAKENLRTEENLAAAIAVLLSDLKAYSPTDSKSAVRHRALLRKVQAMDTRMRMVMGQKFTFAEEAKLLYDVDLPTYDFSNFDRVLEEIEELFPGEDDLSQRVDAFRDSLAIPNENLETIIRRAIDECRARTLRHMSVPQPELFSLEFVTGKNWSGYNWYQGDNESLMQINTDFPVRIDRAIDLGCHEGYPGHHVWNVLVENTLLTERGWVEFSIFPLFSPQGLIAEGSGNYGVELAFPGDEKLAFEREVLFPLAGLDPAKAQILDRLNGLIANLDHSLVATAQLYLDGKISRDEAIEQRQKYMLASTARAEQSVGFIEQYRSYVLNYSLGQDIVRAYVERQGDDPETRWDAFQRMLTELTSASDMTE